jgi:hypothetical protein
MSLGIALLKVVNLPSPGLSPVYTPRPGSLLCCSATERVATRTFDLDRLRLNPLPEYR